MTVQKKAVQKKFLTFSFISTFLLSQFLSSWPVLAVNEETSSSSQVATESAEREIDIKALLNLIMGETTRSAEIATESAQATDSASLSLPDISTLETTPSAQLRPPKNKKPSLAKGNLKAGEKLQVDLGDYQANEVKAFIYDSSDKEIELDVGQTEDGQITFTFPNAFRPGKYHLKILDESSLEVLIEQDFTWGVLAINTNKSIYLPGETANLAMAVLDESGRMVCDAKLTLKITNPQGETKELSTEKETIKVNPECQLHNYTEKPDYEAVYQTKGIGAYQMELLAETQNGSFTINDSFEVQEQVAFDIERMGPTRIYPPSIYTVSFNVMANQDFEGVVEETVPSDFEILPLENKEEVLGETTLAEVVAEVENNTLTSYQRSYDKVKQQEKTKVISWYVSVKNGEKINLGYRFDAPDISPQFYLLGPLKFINSKSETVFQETRQWQIAADATACSSTATGGNWGTSTTWNSPCNISGGPTVANDVTITAGATVTVEASTTRAAYSVTFTTGTSQNTILQLSSSGGAVLNVSTSVNIIYAKTSGNSVSLYVDQNTLTAGSITIGGGSRAYGALLRISTGTVTVSGDISFNASYTTDALTFTDAGTVNLTGNFGASGALTTVAGSTINFNGSSAQTTAGYTYNVLKSNNAAGVTLTANSTITTLTIGNPTSNSLFSDGGFTITPGASSVLNLTSGTYSLGAGTATSWPAWGTRNIAAGTTVQYAATPNQTVSSTPAYQNLTISGAGTKTMTGVTSVAGNFTASGGTATPVLATISGNFLINGGTITTGANLAVTGNTTLSSGSLSLGNFTFSTGSLTVSAGTITTVGYAFTVTGATTINGGTLTLNNNTGNKLLQGAVAVSSGTLNGASTAIQIENNITQSSTGSVAITGTTTFQTNAAQALGGTTSFAITTIGSGVTLTNNGTTTITGLLTLTGDWVQANGSTLNYSSTSAFSGAGTFSASTATNTVNYTASGTQTVKDPNGGTAHTYSNLGLSGTSAKTMTGVTTVNDFTMSGSASTIDNVLTTVNGNFSLSGTSTTTTGAALAVTGSTTVGTGTFLIIGVFVTSMPNITVTSTGTMTNNGTLTISGTLSVTTVSNGFTNNGTVTVTTALSGAGSFINAGAGILNYGATAVPAITTLTTTAVGNTVNYTGASPVIRTVAYHHLGITGSGTVTGANFTVTTIVGNLTISTASSLVVTTGAALAVTGTTTVGTGTSLTIGAFTTSIPNITVTDTGTFTNGGTLTVSTTLAGTGTFTNGAAGVLNFGGSTLDVNTFDPSTAGNTVNYNANGDQTPRNVATYHHLTLSTAGAKNLGNTTTAINGNFTLSGTVSSQTAANLTIGGALSVGAGTSLTIGVFTFSVGTTTNIASTGSLIFSSATNPSKTFTGDVTVSGIWNEQDAIMPSFGGNLTNSATTWTASTGLHTFTGANKTISGTTITVIPSVTITGTIANSNTLAVATLLTVTSPGVLTNNGTVTASTSLTGNGGLTQGSSAILNLGGTVDISTLTAIAGTNTVNYTGSGQTIKDTTYVNLTISGTISTGNQTANVGGVFNVLGGTFTPSSGTMTMNNGSSITNSAGNLAFNNLSVGSGATSSTLSSFNINGNFTDSGTFTASNGTITFSGADGSTQQISGNSTSFYNFTASTVGIGSSGRTLQFAGGSSINVGGTWVVTGESGKVITLKSSNETNWTINPTAANVTYVDVYRSTNTGVSFCATYSTKDANCLGWSVTAGGGSCNQAPNSPSSLAQKKTDDTVISTGGWINQTSVKFTATASDSDTSDTLRLCVEKDDINTSFSGGEIWCGFGVGYTGGSVPVSVTITGITDATQYHWHARVKDAASTYSSWVAYGDNPTGDGSTDGNPANSDFGVDTTAPIGGSVYDGTETGVDKSFNGGSLSQLSANWDNINSQVSGLNYYEYSIGTSIGGTEVGSWVSVGTGTSATATGLTLQTSAPYYFNVRAIDNATNTQTAISSNGQFVSPSLTFSVSPLTLTLDNLNVGNSYSDTKITTLTTSTNAYGGYVVRAFVTDYLRSVGVGNTIPDFDGGTYASPGTWEVENTGFGYTSSDTTIQEFGDKFGGGNLYAPFSQDGPGDIVADHTNNVTGDPISNEQFTITNKVKAGLTQASSYYSTTAVYTATAQY